MNKNWKKLLVGTMCISLLAGCQSKDNSKKNDENSKQTSENASGDTANSNKYTTKESLSGIYNGELEQNITLHILENQTAIKQGYLDDLLKAFNEAYKDYGITAVDANIDEYSDLAQDGPYGLGPDVLYQANDTIMKYVQGKHIYPIPVESLECYSQITDSAWNAYTSEEDGITYMMGVPVNVQSPVLFYRKDLLPEDWETTYDKNQNKIPDMIETWNGLYQYSKSISDPDKEKFGYMKSIYDSYFSLGYLFSYGGALFGNNNTDPSQVCLADGNAEVGANVIIQLASVMNKWCLDATVTGNQYTKMAEGDYFATMTTPDVYTLFVDELTNTYKDEGLSEEEARAKAEENLVMTNVPELPESGDLSEENAKTMPMTVMGGINGYAISAYTKYPNACLAFIDFATSYDMIMKRNEKLGIVPARKDAADKVGGIGEIIYSNLDKGYIVPMPSLTELAQVWSPCETMFTDFATDAFRDEKEKKYATKEAIKAKLEDTSKEIYDAIYALTKN